MVDLHLSDDEQAERLKAWWKENGTSVIIGALIGIGIIVGLNFWREYKTSQAESASGFYENMLANYRDKNMDLAAGVGEKVMGNYSSTPYAGKAALLLAKIKFEENDLATAKSHLRWAMDNAIEAATRHAARLRLARIFFAEKEYDQASALIVVDDYGGFRSEYKELQGDIHMARGETVEARDAYQAALEDLPKGSSYGEILQIKADNAVVDINQ